MKPQLLAYYLPQYHPTPENDEWWGKGFTEWTNVTKARSFFNGHKQPKFPADLGYYDLRVPEIREAQAKMAKDYGIAGFCYYHYWFGGNKQMLNRPIDEVIASGSPDFPFCFCWANQSWTGHWFGAEKKMLIKQTYPGDEDIEAHFFYLLKAFKDKRYIRIDNKPVFKILDIGNLPDPAYLAIKLKLLAKANGLEGLYLIAGNFVKPGWSPLENNFDAITDDSFKRTLGHTMAAKRKRVRHLFFNRYTKFLTGKKSAFRQTNTVTMKEFNRHYKIEKCSYPSFPIVIPNWDNTPRSLQNGIVITDSDPSFFAEQLSIAARHLKETDQPPVIFIKSWNEWAEGNWLEPDREYGYGYLEVTRKFMNNSFD